MHRVGILSAAAAVAAFVLMAPLTVSAAPATLATCLHDPLVDALADAEVYSGPDSFRMTDKVVKNHAYDCFGLSLGRRYSACGEINGNGWLKVEGQDHPDQIGWSPQACFEEA